MLEPSRCVSAAQGEVQWKSADLPGLATAVMLDKATGSMFISGFVGADSDGGTVIYKVPNVKESNVKVPNGR